MWENVHIPGKADHFCAWTPEHPNAGGYRRTADAFRSGNMTLLSSLIAADVVWQSQGAPPWQATSTDAMHSWRGSVC